MKLVNFKHIFGQFLFFWEQNRNFGSCGNEGMASSATSASTSSSSQRTAVASSRRVTDPDDVTINASVPIHHETTPTSFLSVKNLSLSPIFWGGTPQISGDTSYPQAPTDPTTPPAGHHPSRHSWRTSSVGSPQSPPTQPPWGSCRSRIRGMNPKWQEKNASDFQSS